MKKLILLSISVFLGLQLAVNSSAKAQNFHIVASFGSTQSWGVPTAVMYELDYFYPYHRLIHVDRFRDGRMMLFNVLLERNGSFIELTFGNGGNIYNTSYFNNYPLASHICSGYCGFHSDYYYQQQVVCRAHNHRGHNHVNYYQQPRYSRPNSIRVVYNNGYRSHGHHKSNKYHGKNGQYKNNGNGRGNYRDDNKQRFENNNSHRGTANQTRVATPQRGDNNNNQRIASSSNGRNNSSGRGNVSSRESSNSNGRSSNSRSTSSGRSSRD